MWHNLVVLIRWLNIYIFIFVWQNILKNPNEATCHIFRLPCVNKILVCIVIKSVVANVVL
jgi:hypothetical protein